MHISPLPFLSSDILSDTQSCCTAAAGHRRLAASPQAAAASLQTAAASPQAARIPDSVQTQPLTMSSCGYSHKQT